MDRRVFLFSALALIVALLGYTTATDIVPGNITVYNNYTNYTNYTNITGTADNSSVDPWKVNASNLTGSKNINVSVLPFDTCTQSPVQLSWWNGSWQKCWTYTDDDSAYETIIAHNNDISTQQTNNSQQETEINQKVDKTVYNIFNNLYANIINSNSTNSTTIRSYNGSFQNTGYSIILDSFGGVNASYNGVISVLLWHYDNSVFDFYRNLDVHGYSILNSTDIQGLQSNDTQDRAYVNTSLATKANATGTTNYYVELNGSDSNNCTSGSTACLTFQAVWNKLAANNILTGDVRIDGGHGVFYGQVIIPAITFGGFNVTTYGKMNSTVVNVSDGGYDTTYGNNTGKMGYVYNSTAKWANDTYINKLLMNPSGQMAVITGNNRTTINYSLSSTYFTKFSPGQNITILDWNTTIECNFQNTATAAGCLFLKPNANAFTYMLKVNNNASGTAVYGDFQTQFYPQYSYFNGSGNAGTVQLKTISYLNTINSVFVGDGYVVRLEKGSVLYDRNSASNYYLQSLSNSGKSGMFIYLGSSIELNEGFYIGSSQGKGTQGIWFYASQGVVSAGTIQNTTMGINADVGSKDLESNVNYQNVTQWYYKKGDNYTQR